jgi:hypothetical protein
MRARESADLYLKAREVTRRNTRVRFVQPLKERIVREVSHALSREGCGSGVVARQSMKLAVVVLVV